MQSKSDWRTKTFYLGSGAAEAGAGRSQHMRLAPVKVWFRWLVRNRGILSNPAADIDMPRVERRLPRYVRNAEEAERIEQTQPNRLLKQLYRNEALRGKAQTGEHAQDGDQV